MVVYRPVRPAIAEIVQAHAEECVDQVDEGYWLLRRTATPVTGHIYDMKTTVASTSRRPVRIGIGYQMNRLQYQFIVMFLTRWATATMKATEERLVRFRVGRIFRRHHCTGWRSFYRQLGASNCCGRFSIWRRWYSSTVSSLFSPIVSAKGMINLLLENTD